MTHARSGSAKSGSQRGAVARVQLEPEFYPEPSGAQLPYSEKSLEEAIYITPAPQKYDVSTCDGQRFPRSPAFSFEGSRPRRLAWYTDKGCDVTESRNCTPGPDVYGVTVDVTYMHKREPEEKKTSQRSKAKSRKTPAFYQGLETWGRKRHMVTLKGRLSRDVSVEFGQEQIPVE